MNDIGIAGLTARTVQRLDALCLTHPDRAVGRVGGLAATEFLAAAFSDLAVEVERIGFECTVWEPKAASLSADGEMFVLSPGPYSAAVSGQARLVAASTLAELESCDCSGAVLLLHGEIAADQFAPKNYPFYQVAEHQRAIAEIERQQPIAVVAATGSNPGSVGSLSPFPLFEDGDFAVPSAYFAESDGARLLAHAGQPVRIEIDSATRPGNAEQLVARIPGSGPGRVIVCAHVDSRQGTPGALDNATGVCCLLAAAEYLAGIPLERTIEFLPFNGEDNFAAYGEMAYLATVGADLTDVALAINIDAAGYREGGSAVSMYGCPDDVTRAVSATIERYADVNAGPSWPMSDHMVFALRGVPAVAVTSEKFPMVSSRIAHGPDDLPELTNPGLVAHTGRFVAELASVVANA